MTTALGPWRKPLNRNVAAHQKIVDAVNRSANVSATGDLFVGAGPGGMGVIDGRQENWLEVREGVITDEGPGGAADFADARYWIKWIALTPAASDQLAEPVASPPAPTSPGGSDYSEPYPVVATNRAEQAAGTHSLPTDETCWVMAVGYADVDGNRRWVFAQAPAPSPDVLLQIESIEGTGGIYSGLAYTGGAAAVDPAGFVSFPYGMTAAAETVVIVNQDEQGFDGGDFALHRLSLGRFAVGHKLQGYTTTVEGTPRDVYVICRGQYKEGLYAELDEADIDPGLAGMDDEAPKRWSSRDASFDIAGVPVTFPVITRMEFAFNASTGFYAIRYMVRIHAHDADGRLATIGPGTNVYIDLPFAPAPP